MNYNINGFNIMFFSRGKVFPFFVIFFKQNTVNFFYNYFFEKPELVNNMQL